MRKLVKIFMTVAAGMMAFSCATDTTDDLGVNLGKGQKTVISVSLEESRTQLGGYDKDAKKYPMYWSAGDKISANGAVSEAAVISTSNEAVASFAVNGLNEPDHYFVAYPAVEGDWQVKFAAEQNNLSGEKNTTFDEGVSTMYGYSEEGLNVQMNHLTGILKIGIVLPEGSAAKELIKAQISTVDRKPIAGTFDFAFQKDAEGNILTDKKGNKLYTLTPTADAVSVIEYIFGKGKFAEGEWQGSSTPISTDPNYPTYIHVAVPAGIYDELYVTLYDLDGGVMYATVKADDNKPLAAGKVREFKKDDVEQLIEYTPADVYVVSDAESLKKVADEENLSATVVMVADVDMSSVTDWKSIENFAGSFYGNGYAIKGLKAPLFGTTTASVIKGVHLEDVAIESSSKVLGALACKVDNTEAEISHCSTEGALTLLFTVSSGIKLGGIIGETTSTKQISGLVNQVNITISGDKASRIFNGQIGGCIGSAVAPIYNSKNLGTIIISKCTSNSSVWFGGVCGKAKSFTNCQNGELNKNGEPSEKGKITLGSDVTLPKYTTISGIGTAASTVSNCINYGSIEFNSKYINESFYLLSIAGVNASTNSGSCSTDVSNCKNYGDITITGELDHTDAHNNCIGGVVSGYRNGDLLNLENYVDIEISNTATFGGSLKLYIAGVAASTVSKQCTNFINKGNITVLATKANDSTPTIYVGGLVNNFYSSLTNANCYCNISAAGYTNVGMLTGAAYNAELTVTGCKVGGSILKGDMTAATPLNEGNFFEYIYGSENSADAASGCEYWNGK